MKQSVVADFVRLAREGDLAGAALAIAKVEYPALAPEPYLRRLDRMGQEVRERIASLDQDGEVSIVRRLAVISDYLFRERGLTGDREAYDDPRNSLLNAVLDRGLGIPISLGLLYIEVARRAGIRVDGVNFPGHFLLTCPEERTERGGRAWLVLDPFDSGAVLSERECRALLRDQDGEGLSFDPGLLVPASAHQVLARMLLDLKRSYVAMRSFPQARDATEMLLAIDPTAFNELRDRGLLSYQLNDFGAALRDLETYLRFSSGISPVAEPDEDREQIWEYVKALRKRVASYN
jgi:regulator of sirC expression with transglutaminase-like and TPR domain